MISLACSLLLLLAAPGQAPADGGREKTPSPRTVRDFGAKGDAIRDDTKAIQQAIDEGPALVDFPDGTYRLSATLNWPKDPAKRLILRGRSRDKVILKLDDRAPGFGDPDDPRALLGDVRRADRRTRVEIEGITLDTGRRNPGAIGLQTFSRQEGSLRDVTIRSGDSRGMTGLNLLTFVGGPFLVEDLKVVGFDFGVRVGGSPEAVVLERITLEDQGRFSLVNEGQSLTVRKLTTRGAVTAAYNGGRAGVMVLIDLDLRGVRTANARPAVLNEGTIFVRDLRTVGYAEAIRDNSGQGRRPPAGRSVPEYSSVPIRGVDPSSPPESPRLAISEPAKRPSFEAKDQAEAAAFGVQPDDEGDDTQALQKAIDSGRSEVILPAGAVRLSGTVHLRGRLRRLRGAGGTLTGDAILRIEDGAAPEIALERLRDRDAAIKVEIATTRTVAMRGCAFDAIRGNRPGPLFLDDVRVDHLELDGRDVWARLLRDREGTNSAPIENRGGRLWILGLAARRNGTLVATSRGGSTEILGGVSDDPSGSKPSPLFTVEDGSLWAAIGEDVSEPEPFGVLLSVARPGGMPDLLKDAMPPERTIVPRFLAAPRGKAPASAR